MRIEINTREIADGLAMSLAESIKDIDLSTMLYESLEKAMKDEDVKAMLKKLLLQRLEEMLNTNESI